MLLIGFLDLMPPPHELRFQESPGHDALVRGLFISWQSDSIVAIWS